MYSGVLPLQVSRPRSRLEVCVPRYILHSLVRYLGTTLWQSSHLCGVKPSLYEYSIAKGGTQQPSVIHNEEHTPQAESISSIKEQY